MQGQIRDCAKALLILIFALCDVNSNGVVLEGNFLVTDKYPKGFTGRIQFPATRSFEHGWLLNITFDIPVLNFQVYEGDVIGVHPANQQFIVQHLDYNKAIYRDATGVRNFFCQGAVDSSPSATVWFIPLADEYESVHDALARAQVSGITGDNPPPASNTPPSLAIQPNVVSSLTNPPEVPSNTTFEPWWPPVFEPITESTASTPVQPTSQTTTTTQPNLGALNLRYNLREVITKSLLFFESQRSGLLPPNNRVKWRSHSALSDGSDRQIDLAGGYYIDGGFIKYGFPMAFSTTMLSWGVLEFRNAYLASHQMTEVLQAIKWATDYFIKCHLSPFELIGQISTTEVDNAYWGRPEDFKGFRQSFVINQEKPGSDLAAETAAAMAATALVFNSTNATYANSLIRHATELLDFAERYRGSYHESIQDAAISYKSWSGYWDELAWASLWLYKATGQKNYLERAKDRLEGNPDKSEVVAFNWDDKRAGALLLLSQITGHTDYTYPLTDFCDYMLPGRGAPYTPRGLVYIDEWGPNRHAANVGVICALAANLGIRSDIYRRFAHGQLAYMLGDGGRSYVVDFGTDPPTRPYHRASSCPNLPAPCSWDDKGADKPNPQILTGALIAGPDKWDSFDDDRDDYKHNAVGLDYNAGLQTLAAAILYLQVTGETFSEPNPEELNAAVSQTFSIKHDYAEVIRKSLLFYEAQRSGQLPPDNRISWRRSAFVKDVGDNGEDLSGGYFDAGDYVKFNFPMAFATTVLSWSVTAYKEAYVGAGELENAKLAIKWATDYFVKCHVSKYELYGQVGNGVIDHSHWKAPEDMESVERPAYKITRTSPGTELAAETAAAMAAASLVFNETDPDYANLLLGHALDLYDFASHHREQYHRSIKDAAKFYRSVSGYEDEMIWALVWLHIATKDPYYLSDAEDKYKEFNMVHERPGSFTWDNKIAGVQLLLAQTTKKQNYRKAVERFCDQFLPENGHKYTPRGLVFIDEWAPLRHAAAVSYICLNAANDDIRPDVYRKFAKRQIHYMLGDSGLGSFVVGYGPNPPKRPHHRASSCPTPPESCGFNYLRTSRINVHELVGALVGGPDQNDMFVDDRTNVKSNEVALDYNAGFQAAVVALKYLEMYPPVTATVSTTATATKEPKDNDEMVTQPLSSIDSDNFGWLYEDFDISDESNVTNRNNVISPPTTTNPPKVSGSSESENERKDCEVVAVTDVFQDCYKVLEATPAKYIQCRWNAFVRCVNLSVGHCRLVWDLFKIWNSIPDKPYFSEQGQKCLNLTTTAKPEDLLHVQNVTTTASSTIVTTNLPKQTFEITAPSKETATPKHDLHTRISNTTSTQFETVQGSDEIVSTTPADSIVTGITTSNEDKKDETGISETTDRNELKADDTVTIVSNESRRTDVITTNSSSLNVSSPTLGTSIEKRQCLKEEITYTFTECYIKSKQKDRDNVDEKKPSCRWITFKACYMKYVGHCHNVSSYWHDWNTGSTRQRFTEDDLACGMNPVPSTTTTTATTVQTRIRFTTTLASYPNVNLSIEGCRQFEVFQFCAIDKNQYTRHVASKTYKCRYNAFKDCARKQGVACTHMWSQWDYWNTQLASNDMYFSVDDVRCEEEDEVAIRTCSTTGLAMTFSKCYETSKITHETALKLEKKSCRWKQFEDCYNGVIGHCPNVFYSWRAWDHTLAKGRHFTEKERTCGSANKIFSHMWTLVTSILFIIFFLHLF